MCFPKVIFTMNKDILFQCVFICPAFPTYADNSSTQDSKDINVPDVLSKHFTLSKMSIRLTHKYLLKLIVWGKFLLTPATNCTLHQSSAPWILERWLALICLFHHPAVFCSLFTVLLQHTHSTSSFMLGSFCRQESAVTSPSQFLAAN